MWVYRDPDNGKIWQEWDAEEMRELFRRSEERGFWLGQPVVKTDDPNVLHVLRDDGTVQDAVIKWEERG
ncbi:hypothetical protein [Saccharopolyspora pogona]|uniref:hypothetical protein n=1 Tax=Saccharopolyspora pogona TaxID=333966 RepID=UPI001683E20A|nr:hypothetical protein [Saccharopolyspora pogona]